jgi:hypothetical protein
MPMTVSPVSAQSVFERLGTSESPVILDVRDNDQIMASGRTPVGALRFSDHTSLSQILSSRDLILCGENGVQSSFPTADRLIAGGYHISVLAGGYEDWLVNGLPTRNVFPIESNLWVTRERPKIDRIACPWLIRRFINPAAEFLYVPADAVIRTAEAEGAMPYDIDGVLFSHEGERCSFDTLLRVYNIDIPALNRLAPIIRGADTSRHDLAPQCAGLFAISLGLSANFADDHKMLREGMTLYDALFTWCRAFVDENAQLASGKAASRRDHPSSR